MPSPCDCCFARALAHNPVYLLLDEAASNIDVETEARIRRAMGRLLEGRTSIVIAHRLSTVLAADRIVVMHKGRVAEVGNHEDLLARRGLYWRLFQIQFGDQYGNEEPLDARASEDDSGRSVSPGRSGNGYAVQHTQ
jgi:ATP-binding cassette subfamily B protein